MGQQIKLENVQINYPALMQPKTSKNFPNNPPSYGVVAILDPANPLHAQKINEIQQSLDSQNASVFQDRPRGYPSSWKKQPDGKIHVNLNSSQSQPPQCVDQNVQPVLVDNGTVFYSGAICNVVIDVYTTTNHGGKLCFGLLMVQKVSDGERLDNRPKADELFAPIPVPGQPATGPAGGQNNPLG